MTAIPVDQLIGSLVLEAVRPAGLELSLRAAEQADRDRDRVHAAWRQKMERSTYEADRRGGSMTQPSRKTGWWPASWSGVGKRLSQPGVRSRRTMPDSRWKMHGRCRPPTGSESALWPRTCRPYGRHRRRSRLIGGRSSGS